MKNIHSMISMKMTQNKQPFSHLADELELMPELSDQYKGAEILPPRLDQMAMCQVVAQSCGTYLIHDTETHQHDFTVVKITDLTASIIAKSIYAQCDIDGNNGLLLDLLVDYHKNNKAVSLSEQQNVYLNK